MEREGNYTIQANQAKAHFLGYDQEKLIRKLGLRTDGSWLKNMYSVSRSGWMRATGPSASAPAGPPGWRMWICSARIWKCC